MNEKEVKKAVKERYTKAAETRSCCSGCAPCGSSLVEQALNLGYTEKELEQIPEEVIMGLGCGNPTALADLKEGETVLDLGSGAGIDVFLAAHKIGRNGRAIGVDMTEAMIKKANSIAKEYGYKNVEFKLGEIENLPVENNSIDVIISNCVINLTVDKLKAYEEAYRVLKPGGRMLISDLVTEGELPEEIKKNFDAWAECIAGAMEKSAYIETIKKAGFKNVWIVDENVYSELGLGETLANKIISVKVEAYK